MFRILSIDGGGIRGIIPAKILALLEEELGRRGMSTHICDYFDMICGTSTGGIIAIGLGLGMPAKEILKIYKENAEQIFPRLTPMKKIRRICRGKSFYENKKLKELISMAYDASVGESPARLGHSHTRLCIPTYDAQIGAMHVLKTSHHNELIRDYQMPAVDVAMSTTAAPIYFDSYKFCYTPKGGGEQISYSNIIDGGIMANNPTLIGYTEAVQSLGIHPSDLAILSLGTGNNLLHDKPQTIPAKYWLFERKALRLYDLISSAQADYTSNLMKFFQRGIGNAETPLFIYERIQHSFSDETEISMDDSSQVALTRLDRIGQELYGKYATYVIGNFFASTKEEFIPSHRLSE